MGSKRQKIKKDEYHTSLVYSNLVITTDDKNIMHNNYGAYKAAMTTLIKAFEKTAPVESERDEDDSSVTFASTNNCLIGSPAQCDESATSLSLYITPSSFLTEHAQIESFGTESNTKEIFSCTDVLTKLKNGRSSNTDITKLDITKKTVTELVAEYTDSGYHTKRKNSGLSNGVIQMKREMEDAFDYSADNEMTIFDQTGDVKENRVFKRAKLETSPRDAKGVSSNDQTNEKDSQNRLTKHDANTLENGETKPVSQSTKVLTEPTGKRSFWMAEPKTLTPEVSQIMFKPVEKGYNLNRKQRKHNRQPGLEVNGATTMLIKEYVIPCSDNEKTEGIHSKTSTNTNEEFNSSLMKNPLGAHTLLKQEELQKGISNQQGQGHGMACKATQWSNIDLSNPSSKGHNIQTRTPVHPCMNRSDEKAVKKLKHSSDSVYPPAKSNKICVEESNSVSEATSSNALTYIKVYPNGNVKSVLKSTPTKHTGLDIFKVRQTVNPNPVEQIAGNDQDSFESLNSLNRSEFINIIDNHVYDALQFKRRVCGMGQNAISSKSPEPTSLDTTRPYESIEKPPDPDPEKNLEMRSLIKKSKEYHKTPLLESNLEHDTLLSSESNTITIIEKRTDEKVGRVESKSILKKPQTIDVTRPESNKCEDYYSSDRVKKGNNSKTANRSHRQKRRTPTPEQPLGYEIQSAGVLPRTYYQQRNIDQNVEWQPNKASMWSNTKPETKYGDKTKPLSQRLKELRLKRAGIMREIDVYFQKYGATDDVKNIPPRLWPKLDM